MCLESPVGGSVHTCTCECTFDTKLIFSCLDIISNFLQIIKTLDVVQCVSSFLKKSFVYDQAISLDNICNTINSVTVFNSVSIGSKLWIDIGIFQIIAVIFPAFQSNRSVYLEQSRSIALSHLRLKSCLILSGSCCNNLYIYTSLLCVSFCKVLPSFISFWFKVQIIYLSCSIVCHCRYSRNHGCCHNCCKSHCHWFSHLHFLSLLFMRIIFGRILNRSAASYTLNPGCSTTPVHVDYIL